MINKTIDIWDGLTYAGEMADGFRPTLTTYIRSGEKERGMVLILPGGGYELTSPREAEPIAMVFNNAGYHAAVLSYSVAPRRHPQPVMDAARALTLVKEHGDRWQVDLKQLFVIGFSAGGHLAAAIANMSHDHWLNEVEGIECDGIQLKGNILSYPVLTGGVQRHAGSFDNLLGDGTTQEERDVMSMELLVTGATPKTFLWHTVEDMVVPVENSLLYASALRAKGVPFEMHIYPEGQHGLSLCNEETADEAQQIQPHVSGWMDQCLEWMALL